MLQKILRFATHSPKEAERAQRVKKVIELGKAVATAADFDGSIQRRENELQRKKEEKLKDMENAMMSLRVSKKKA